MLKAFRFVDRPPTVVLPSLPEATIPSQTTSMTVATPVVSRVGCGSKLTVPRQTPKSPKHVSRFVFCRFVGEKNKKTKSFQNGASRRDSTRCKEASSKRPVSRHAVAVLLPSHSILRHLTNIKI